MTPILNRRQPVTADIGVTINEHIYLSFESILHFRFRPGKDLQSDTDVSIKSELAHLKK